MGQYVVKEITGSAGRWLEVAPARFPGWIAGFAERHGAAAPDAALTVALSGENVIYTALDGAVAECHPPFPPVPFPAGGAAAPIAPGASGASIAPSAPSAPGAPSAPAAWALAIAAHAAAPRAVGVLLVRLGGYAAGVFTGSPPVLAESKAGARPVHGRSAAGGWSQHRFSRRREKQASEALQAAADAAVAVFGRWQGRRIGAADNSNRRQDRDPGDNSNRRQFGLDAVGLDAVVLGGDKRAVAELRADPRLAPYLDLATDRFLTVPDPKLAVLKDTPRLFLAVRIRLREPAT